MKLKNKEHSNLIKKLQFEKASAFAYIQDLKDVKKSLYTKEYKLYKYNLIKINLIRTELKIKKLKNDIYKSQINYISNINCWK